MAPSVNYRPETQQWATRPADHAFPSSIPSKPHLTSHGSMSFSPYRIQHVNLSVPVGTLEQAEEFYGTVLGFAPDPVPQLQRDSLRWFRVGDTGQQVHVSFDEPNSGKTRCHPCFALRDGEALLELQKRIWDAFQKGGKAAPMAADEPGKENSGAKVGLTRRQSWDYARRIADNRVSSTPPAFSVGTMQATDSSSVCASRQNPRMHLCDFTNYFKRQAGRRGFRCPTSTRDRRAWRARSRGARSALHRARRAASHRGRCSRPRLPASRTRVPDPRAAGSIPSRRPRRFPSVMSVTDDSWTTYDGVLVDAEVRREDAVRHLHAPVLRGQDLRVLRDVGDLALVVSSETHTQLPHADSRECQCRA